MKLVRKVEWKGLKQVYEVEWRLVDVSLQLPRWVEIDLDERRRITLSYVEDDEGEYWTTKEWYKDTIDHVDLDTRNIIDAVREAARQAREKEAIAERLTGVFMIDID